MFSTSSTVYTAKNQSRCLASVVGDTSRHRFFVGTCSVRDENEIAVLEYEDESNALTCLGSLGHPGQILVMEPSPYENGNRIATGSYQRCSMSQESLNTTVCLWDCSAASEWMNQSGSMDDEMTNSNSFSQNDQISSTNNVPSLSRDMSSDDWARSRRADLQKIFEFPQMKNSKDGSNLLSFLWCPKEHENNHFVATLCTSSLCKWDIQSTSSEIEPQFSISVPRATSAAWSPHAVNEIGIGLIDSILFFDERTYTQKPTIHINQPHDGAVLDLDYNPNKPFNICTAADDGNIKFWDTRNYSSPLKIVRAHSNFCNKAKYNPSHDQLLVSAGADNLVHLWRISSISSAPLLELQGPSSPTTSSNLTDENDDDDDKDTDKPTNFEHRQTDATAADILVKTFDLHDDSVYGVAWSAHDVWAFASLSYDGRLVLNHVPSPEKYKILL